MKNQKHKRIAITAASLVLGAVIPLAGASAYAAVSGSGATAAPSGTAAKSMVAFQEPGAAASSTQYNRLSSIIGADTTQTISTAGRLSGQSASRVLLNQGSAGTLVIAAPTDAGQVCENVNFADGNGFSGCVQDLSSLPGSVAPTVGSGSSGVYEVSGLAADSVTAVSVITADGNAHQATLSNGAFAWTSSAKGSAPSTLTVSKGSIQSTVSLPTNN